MRVVEPFRPRREAFAYVALPGETAIDGDALGIVDLRDASATYGRLVHEVGLPRLGLLPGRLTMASDGEPGSRILLSGESSRILPSAEDSLFVSALDPASLPGAPRVAVFDHDELDITDMLTVQDDNVVPASDMWCCPRHKVLVTGESGSADISQGVTWPAMNGERGHRLQFWTLDGRHLVASADLGAENKLLRIEGANHPNGLCYGFANVLISARHFSASVWCWFQQRGTWQAKKVIEIPPEQCKAECLPPALAPLGVVPPFLTDIKLSPNDRFLYLSCWGTGELLQYDVLNPLRPRLTGTVRLGGIVQQFPHPQRPVMHGGPQALSISADGLRIYVTNSTSPVLDRQIYPGKDEGWMVKFDALPLGGLTLDDQFLVSFGAGRPQQSLLAL